LAARRPAAAGSRKAAPPSAPLSEAEASVFENLSVYPIHVDDLTRQLKLEAGQLSSILLSLELKGLVRQDPGKLFSRSDDDQPRN
jgi:DNA processing protein